MIIRAAVLGADVSKSRSPAIHEAAYRALGLGGEYGRVSTDARRFGSEVASAWCARQSYLSRASSRMWSQTGLHRPRSSATYGRLALPAVCSP